MNALSKALNEANVNDWSAREIARRADGLISHDAVTRYMTGRGPSNPRENVLQAFAKVFGIPLTKLRELAGQPRGQVGPYIPPPEAARLNQRERRVLDELIKIMATKEVDPAVGSGAFLEATVTSMAARDTGRKSGRQADRDDFEPR